MQVARIDEKKWVRCGNCGHKLFRLVSDNPTTYEVKISQWADGDLPERNASGIEIKCHSCKQINFL